MSRPSVSGTPYLVLRPEAGKYAYWRILRSEIAPSIKGLVFASWLLKPHDLMGKAVVKISLKTGDKQLAQRRWLDFHTRVETLGDVVRLERSGARVRFSGQGFDLELDPADVAATVSGAAEGPVDLTRL